MSEHKAGRLLFSFPDRRDARKIRDELMKSKIDDNLVFCDIHKFQIIDLDNQIAYEYDGKHLYVRSDKLIPLNGKEVRFL